MGQAQFSLVIFMWAAIGLAVAFVGVRVGDHVRSKRRRDRYRTRSGRLGRNLTRPFRRAQDFWYAVKQPRRPRAQRKQWEERKRSRTPTDGAKVRSHRHPEDQ